MFTSLKFFKSSLVLFSRLYLSLARYLPCRFSDQSFVWISCFPCVLHIPSSKGLLWTVCHVIEIFECYLVHNDWS